YDGPVPCVWRSTYATRAPFVSATRGIHASRSRASKSSSASPRTACVSWSHHRAGEATTLSSSRAHHRGTARTARQPRIHVRVVRQVELREPRRDPDGGHVEGGDAERLTEGGARALE